VAAIHAIQRIHGNQAAQRVIQRYREITNKSKPDDAIRVSDDRTMVVQQEHGDALGSQLLWAEPGKAAVASAKLAAAKSVIELKETKTRAFKFAQKGPTKQFAKIEPINLKNATSGTGEDGMELWADCGKSARDVIGAGEGTGGGIPRAVYNEPGNWDTPATTTGTANPAQMKQEIMLTWILYWEKNRAITLIDAAKLTDLQTKRDTARTEFATAIAARESKENIDKIAKKARFFEDEMTKTILDAYNTKLDPRQREHIDRMAGINRWADPDVGEGYTISSGGAEKNKNQKTWNFHWAGVIMKGNQDTVVLENYSVGDAQVQNTDWVYQMYGSAEKAEQEPTKKGQTFHEQHRDVHGQHGETPTTMVVKPR
jgi:hypothetical protein